MLDATAKHMANPRQMEVLLIRHADPDYENDTLTPTGHQEAQMLAASLAGESLAAIYTSPMGRARDTMQYTADLTGLNSTVLDWLREVAAPSVDSWCAWELPGHYSLSGPQLPTLSNWAEQSVFGPSFLPYYNKIADGFDELMRGYGYEKSGHMYCINAPTDQKIALFAHKGSILTLLGYLLHWPLPLIFAHCEISPTGVSRLVGRASGEDWAAPKLQVLNDLSHLKSH